MKSSQRPAKKSSGKSPAERVVRKQLADGTVKEYRYPRQGKKVDLAPRFAADSVDALITAYMHSPEWASLAPRSRAMMSVRFRRFAKIGSIKVSELRRRDILSIRDSIYHQHGPAAANAFISAGQSAFSWGIHRDWLESSPFSRIPKLAGGEFVAWTEEQASKAIAELPERLRRVVILALYTGQRRGDLVIMRWSQIAGGVLHVVQEKTGANVSMPIHPNLIVEMERWRAEAAREQSACEFILMADEKGGWNPDRMSGAMGRGLAKIGLPGISTHGIRKLAAKRLADAGCTTHEIAAITGHKSLSEVQRYTESADRKRLAASAIARLKALG